MITLTDNHYQVLAVLEQLGTATAEDIAQHVKMHHSTVRVMLKALEQNKKVGRQKIVKTLGHTSGNIAVGQGATPSRNKRKVYGYRWKPI